MVFVALVHTCDGAGIIKYASLISLFRFILSEPAVCLLTSWLLDGATSFSFVVCEVLVRTNIGAYIVHDVRIILFWHFVLSESVI